MWIPYKDDPWRFERWVTHYPQWFYWAVRLRSQSWIWYSHPSFSQFISSSVPQLQLIISQWPAAKNVSFHACRSSLLCLSHVDEVWTTDAWRSCAEDPSWPAEKWWQAMAGHCLVNCIGKLQFIMRYFILPYIIIHCHVFLYIIIYYNILLFIIMYYYVLLHIFILLYMFIFDYVYIYILFFYSIIFLYVIIYYYIVFILLLYIHILYYILL